MSDNIPEVGFMRIGQIIGDRRKGTTGPIPVSRSAWYHGVKIGIYPLPVQLSQRTVAWRVEDIRRVIERMGADGR
jgi:hypothetical protein